GRGAKGRRRTGPLGVGWARTTPVIPSGHALSFSNGTIEMGIAVPAPPMISIESCARAGATASINHATRGMRIRITRNREILGGVARRVPREPRGDYNGGGDRAGFSRGTSVDRQRACEAERALELFRHATRLGAIRVRADIDAKQPVDLPNPGFDLGGRELVLHVLEKVLRIGIAREGAELD